MDTSSYFLMVLLLCANSTANRAPDLISSRTLIIRGRSSAGQVATAQLGGLDPDGDTISYQVIVPPTSSLIGRLTLSTTGILSASNICFTCTGVVQFTIELSDTAGSSKTYIMRIRLQDRNGALSFTDDANEQPLLGQGLLRWHIYLIVLSIITLVGVVCCVVIYCRCAFHSHKDGVDLIKKPNRINNTMYIKPERAFTNSGAVKATMTVESPATAPYYGMKKSVNSPVPLRLLSISEEPGKGRNLLAPVRDANALLTQRKWQDISAPH